ncbi:hypothetical protein [Streptomyces kebangsaanensis]|uniref:hypothetical protein n=1 Tax=Streptomyces kebangsaanensis TaxID=864058 RepID=UPI00093EB20F|nr:hypothetical protein [Streptomyces kebangsaanensis]
MRGKKAKAQRRARRERNERWLAEARQEEPRLVSALPDMELWQRGRYTFCVPTCHDDLPDELKQAVMAHRTASLEGACPSCDLTNLVSGKGLVVTRHEEQCPAHPDRLVELGERLGVEVNRRA